ncbi:MAG: accessory gene regulator B family protein [Clostridiales bacterium]|nr:accessory gene regulator B family protein [Clostridiales bacterium]
MDIIEYGLNCMFDNLIGIGATFLIVLVFGSFWEVTVLCLMIFPLRMLMCHKVTQKATDSRHNSVKIDT